jgi:hypothetical protein
MPLRIIVNISRKMGEANYGSRGATIGLEMEAEACLVHQTARFHDQVDQLFALARESVDRELARPAAVLAQEPLCNSRNRSRQGVERTATVSQLRALKAIANEQEIDLLLELRARFGIENLAELTLVQASRLIDELKSEDSSKTNAY